MQIADVAERIRSVRHHPVDQPLLTEERQRVALEPGRPYAGDKRRTLEPVAGTVRANHLAEPVEAAARRSWRGTGWWQGGQQPLRVIVDQRLDTGGQLAEPCGGTEKGRADLLGRFESDLAQAGSENG